MQSIIENYSGSEGLKVLNKYSTIYFAKYGA